MHRPVLAAAASFVVYLFPLLLPHTVTLYGVSLFAGFGRRSAAWVAADIACALGVQLVAFVAFKVLLARPMLMRAMAGIPALIGLLILVHWVHLLALPVAFLIEPDDVAESGQWPEACTIPGASLLSVDGRTAAHPLWGLAPGGVRPVLIDVERCRSVELPELPSGSVHPTALTGQGGLLLFDQAAQTTDPAWWYTPAPIDTAPTPLQPPPGVTATDGRPSVSADGEWVAWMRRRRTPDAVLQEVVRQRIADGAIETTSLGQLGPAGFELLGVDVAADRLIVLVSLSTIAVVGLDGGVREVISAPGGIRPHTTSARWFEEGWVVWDAYRESEPYMVAWQLDTGQGLHRTKKGRGLTSVAVSHDRRLIAVSAATQYSIGRTEDSIYIWRAADGREVFRRYLPTYTRSTVAFVGPDHFAYSDISGVHVLRIAEQ